MTDYIIDPMWFYLIGAVSKLEGFMLVTISTTVVVFLTIAFRYGMIADTLLDDDYIKENRIFKKTTSISITVVLICSLIFTALPSETTMTKMLLAKVVTKTNVECSIEQVKDLIDYTIEKIEKMDGEEND